MPLTIQYPYAQMGKQEEMMRNQPGGGMGYIPNFVDDFLQASAMQQRLNAGKAEMQDYTQSKAVENAYASGDKDAIDKVKKQYPAKAQEYEQAQEVQNLKVASTKMGLFKDELEMSPDLATYNKNHDSFSKFSPDGNLPQFTSDEEFQKWRTESLGGIAKTKIHAEGALGLWEDAHNKDLSPEERAAALDVYQEERQKARDEHDKAVAGINKTKSGGSTKIDKEASPNENDLNAAQAGISSSPYLKDLGADTPADAKKGIPFQYGPSGLARNWIAQNTNDLLHNAPKMKRGDAFSESTAEAELMVDTDKDGNKTFNPTAQVASVNGQYMRVVKFDPKNGYLVKDRDGKQSWYKPKGFKPQ